LNKTLHAFAGIYRRSTAARRCASSRDYTIDYEDFLRKARLDDGDERELAEQELLVAASQSGGHFLIDRHPRSGKNELLRLVRDGGEAWLFAQIGLTAPRDERETLAAFFEAAARRSVPESRAAAWNDWFLHLARRARDGESVQPFQRDDAASNAELIHALAGILHWQGETFIRYASAAICGNSKRLQTLEPRLRPALEAITGGASLENFGILRKPRTVAFHGPIRLRLGAELFDFTAFPAPVILSEANLENTALSTTAPLCLTVENEDTFHELARRNPGILLVQTSFPGSAALKLLQGLPADLPFHHFGDSDPAGSEILRDLRERSARPVKPLLMAHRPTFTPTPLTPHERTVLERLLKLDLLDDLRDDLEHKLAAGEKGAFEQESIPIDEVLDAIAGILMGQEPG
jgi:hypothetical protein